MAYVVDLNTGTDTPITGVSELTINRGLQNWGADWRANTAKDAETANITNLNSPVAYPEHVYFDNQRIANIYKGKNIPLTMWYPDQSGMRLRLTHTGVATITSEDDPSYLCAVPWAITTTLTTGVHPAFGSTYHMLLLERHISDFFETGDTTTARLDALWRGALYPRDI